MRDLQFMTFVKFRVCVLSELMRHSGLRRLQFFFVLFCFVLFFTKKIRPQSDLRMKMIGFR